MSRLEAAAKKFGELIGGGPTVGLDHHYSAQILAAADAHDAANGVHRVSLDEATVERAARILDPDLFRSTHDQSVFARARAKDKARAVLAAAVKEEQ